MSEFLEQQQPQQQQHQQQHHQPVKPLKRELDSTDDFEHLEHELQQSQQQRLLDLSNFEDYGRLMSSPQLSNLHDDLGEGILEKKNLLDTSVPASNGIECDLKPVPATPPPSADLEKFDLGGARDRAETTASFGTGQQRDELEARFREQLEDFKDATMSSAPNKFEERANGSESPGKKFILGGNEPDHFGIHNQPPSYNNFANNEDDDDDMFAREEFGSMKERAPPTTLYSFGDIKSSTLPEPENSPELDFVKDEIIVHEATREKPRKPEEELWNVLEKSGSDRFEEREMLRDEPPNKPLPPLPEHELFLDDPESEKSYGKQDLSSEFIASELASELASESRSKPFSSEADNTGGDSEFESEPEPSLAKSCSKPLTSVKPELGDVAERKYYCQKPVKNREIEEIAPKDIFRRIGIDAWFNPERLNQKVASLIYWRDPKKSGIVFGATLGVLLSLAYFSLISVIAYISLLTLFSTIAFRIYKSVLQAVQKTSDGHPFKEILELDLTLPTSKVHEVADIAVANANAAVTELRRLFLVEDFVDSIKFGFLLWCLTCIGSVFNGMTIIIIMVVALFTLPKIYETNKTQIDQNLAIVQAKHDEIIAKVRAALPIGKKAEPAKEE